MQQPRRRVVRARQRDRAASLRGFDRNLVPLPHEWMVDRLQIRVKGYWQARSGTGREFWQLRLTDPSSNWLCSPEPGQHRHEVVSRTPPSTTFGSLRIKATGVQSMRGAVEVFISCNPTRTLANLIARYPERADLFTVIASLSATEFFQFAEPDTIAPSLDPEGRDNYIPALQQLHTTLGSDFFSTFMPIFVEQCQAKLAALLSSYAVEYVYDGAVQLIDPEDGSVVLDWGNAEVPQIESYFERYHSSAVTAVRTAGLSILTQDSRNTLRRYTDVDFERDGDCFKVSLPVEKTRKLVVYAKTPNRIRFEVRRHGRARYSGMEAEASSSGRICAIVAHERERAIRSCRWLEEVGPQFDEASAPSVGDLIELISKIVQACNGKEAAVRAVTTRLIADGGLSLGLDPAVPAVALERLQAQGVVKMVRLSNSRQPRGRPRRYSLTEDYENLRLALAQALRDDPLIEQLA